MWKDFLKGFLFINLQDRLLKSCDIRTNADKISANSNDASNTVIFILHCLKRDNKYLVNFKTGKTFTCTLGSNSHASMNFCSLVTWMKQVSPFRKTLSLFNHFFQKRGKQDSKTSLKPGQQSEKNGPSFWIFRGFKTDTSDNNMKNYWTACFYWNVLICHCACMYTHQPAAAVAVTFSRRVFTLSWIKKHNKKCQIHFRKSNDA